jgi:PAS domain S-box-containing protein
MCRIFTSFRSGYCSLGALRAIRRTPNSTDNVCRRILSSVKLKDASLLKHQSSPRKGAAQTVVYDEGGATKQNQDAHEHGHDPQINLAEQRTEEALTRTKQAAMRTEQAKTQTEQAFTQTEQDSTRAKQATTRTKQDSTRTKQAETRSEQAKTQTEQAFTQTEQAATRTKQAETRTEQALHDSELSYRRLFEAAKDGILMLDFNTGHIKDVNPFLFKLLGFSRSEMIGRTVGELSPFRDIESNKIMLERLQKDGYVRYEDLPMETRDGHHIAVEFVSNVYQVGDCNVIQCNVRDITERKRVQGQIDVLHAELEQRVIDRTAELEAFSYSVSHDLRAPLRHIMGFVEILQKEAGPSLSEKSLGRLTTISESAKRMGILIDGLLAFSRTGRAALAKADVNLDELVLGVLGDFEVETKDRKIAWAIHPLPAVRGDQGLLRMVLVNLISNALKFTAGRVEAKIEIGCAPSAESETVIFIRDNGAGFDPQYAAKLFGVFQRLHSQAEFEGTGIGLANVERIIHRHGGRVWAEGLVDCGATFYFSIPKQTEP